VHVTYEKLNGMKGKVHPISCHEGTEGGVEVWLSLFEFGASGVGG
jgi:hypothetical protein